MSISSNPSNRANHTHQCYATALDACFAVRRTNLPLALNNPTRIALLKLSP